MWLARPASIPFFNSCAIGSLMCTLIACELLSIRDVVFTVSPNSDQCGIFEPTTPAHTGPPQCSPTRISSSCPSWVRLKRLRHARTAGNHSTVFAAARDLTQEASRQALRERCKIAAGAQALQERKRAPPTFQTGNETRLVISTISSAMFTIATAWSIGSLGSGAPAQQK